MGTRSLTAVTLVVGVSLLAGVSAKAADQGITGKKLLLKSNPQMVLLSKDALVVPGANGTSADPRCAPDGGGLGGSVTLDDGTNSATLNMPCANWSANNAGTLYKYKDAAGTPKIVKMKSGLLKVVSPGMGGFPVPNGPGTTVDVEVTVGTDKYCMTFTGTGDGNKFLVKDAGIGTCPSPTPASTVTPTATPSATANSGPVCCEGSGYCFGSPSGACSPGETPVGGGAVCDASGDCVSGPGTPGGCCHSIGGNGCLMPINPGTCFSGPLGYGAYHVNAVCNPDGACSPGFCGNANLDPGETCDVFDDAACPGLCLPDCTCSPPCGDGNVDAGETCDGDDDNACPGQCLPDCTCPPCAGALVGGFCWFLGADGDSCDATCASQSLSCDPATLTFAGHPSGSLANCDAVLEALLGGPQSTNDSTHGSFGCALVGAIVPIRDIAAPTTCAAASLFFSRACACS